MYEQFQWYQVADLILIMAFLSSYVFAAASRLLGEWFFFITIV